MSHKTILKGICLFALLTILAIFLVVSCSPEDPKGMVQNISNIAGNNSEAEKQDVILENIINEKLSGQQDVLDKLTITNPIELSENFQKGLVGEYKVFLVGIYNSEGKDMLYKLNIKPLNAYDKSSNTIKTDDIIGYWYSKNDFTQFKLASGQKKAVPVIFEIGSYISRDKKTNITTKEGTYVFNLEIYSTDNEKAMPVTPKIKKELFIGVSQKETNQTNQNNALPKQDIKPTNILPTLNLIALTLAIGGVVATWILRYSKRRRTSTYLKRINNVYDDYQHDVSKCEEELFRLKEKIEDDYADGKIESSTFTILDKRISSHLSAIKEDGKKKKL